MAQISLAELKAAAAKPDDLKFFKAVKIGDFLSETLKPPLPMLGSWLPCKGLAMVYAMTGVGKSVFCLTVALSVAAGKGCFGWECKERKRVLYVDGELPQEYLQLAVRKIANGLDLDWTDLDLWFVTIDKQPKGSPPKIDSQIDQAALQSIIETHEIDLIIIDNISTLSGSEFGENEAQSWEGMQSWALMQRSQNRAVLFVHHAGKSGHQRGTSKREDVLDSTLKLSRLETGDEGFRIDYDKHRRGPKPPSVEVFFKNDGEVLDMEFKTVKDDDETLVMMWESGATVNDISETISVTKKTIYNRLNKLEEEGKLDRKVKKFGKKV